MTIQRQALVWGVGFIVFLLLVWVLSGILLPFVAGLAVAYLLDPLADRLETLGLSRLTATTIITVLCVAVFLVSLMVLLPLLYEQSVNFVRAIPELVDGAREFLAGFSDGYLAKMFAYAGLDVHATVSGENSGVYAWVLRQLATGWEQGIAVLGLLSLLIVTPIVAFYMLLDWDNMVSRIDDLVPRDHVDTVRKLAREIDEVLAGFVRGQGAVCFLLGGFYGLGLTLLGLEFGLIVGLIAGLISFIPYVGSIVGFFLAVTIAFFQFWPDYGGILAVALVFVIGQFVEGNFLTPKLVGGRVRLHPLWVMLALFAFGYLFGFLGMLLAVPVAAAMGVFVRFAADRYTRSALYRGESKGEDGA